MLKTFLLLALILCAAFVLQAQTPPVGATIFTVTNNTKGKYKDDQIYWAIIGREGNRFVHVDKDGKLVPMSVADNSAKGHLSKGGQDYSNYFYSLAEAKSIPVPKIGSSRVFISLGSPMYIRVMPDGYAGADINNPTDPNLRIFFDFVEFTIDDRGFHGNTTQVDAFGFPILIELTDASGQIRKAGHVESRAALFAGFKREVPKEFKSCVREPYRIVAPCAADFGKGRSHDKYFDKYLAEVWKTYSTEKKTPGGWTGRVSGGALSFTGPSGKVYQSPMPTTQEVFLGNGVLATNPGFCAAINRHVLANPEDWTNPSKYYAQGPANFYAKFWHDHSINKKAYGFCYDDFNAQDTLIEAARPAKLNITVGWD
jgi:hypothetical protein